MIVASYFKGDEDLTFAWRQHDTYSEALNIIVSRCNEFSRAACVIIHGRQDASWGQITNFDHRTLQGTHDLLAAVYRCSFNTAQLALEPSNSYTETTWLNWLDNEVRDWIQTPILIHHVEMILMNQNTKIGYLSESNLQLCIYDKFSHVPWHKQLREAIEKGAQG